MELQCDLRGADCLKAALVRIEKYVKEHPDTPWIIGSGWDIDWKPTAQHLDPIIPDRPAIFRRVDGHAVWVNTVAMHLACVVDGRGVFELGLDPNQVDWEEDGNPNGIFHEAAADIFRKHMGHLPMETRLEGIRICQRRMAHYGITAFQDALVRSALLEGYQHALARGELFLKCSVCLYWDYLKGMEQIEEFKALREASQRYLRINSVKLLVDGVIESRTASVHEPYLEPTGSASTRTTPKLTRSGSFSSLSHKAVCDRGIPNFEREKLLQIVELLDKEGFQIHCHAVGDKAVTHCLDAFEHAISVNPPRERRHIIAHIQVARTEDIPRFAQLGVVACFQPYWCIPDRVLITIAEPLLGPERSARQYPIRSVLESGGKICFGSDWNVSSLSTFDGLQAAVTHQLLPGMKGEVDANFVWNPNQRISLAQALEAYTKGSAYANFLDHESGCLEAGKCADFVVLSQNLFQIDPMQIHRTKVVMTFVDGRRLESHLSSPVNGTMKPSQEPRNS